MTTLSVEQLSILTKIMVYIPYFVALVFSYSREGFEMLYHLCTGKEKITSPSDKEGYAPLIKKFNIFFERWMFGRVCDVFARPITGVPGAHVNVLLQTGQGNTVNAPMKTTKESKRCLNLGSYNYLGFGENTGPVIDAVEESIYKFGTTTASPRMELGTTVVHRELEKLTAKFLGKEDCISFGMGYATNSTTLPVLCGRGDLIISDALNHASIVVGCRSSGATIKVFKHNNPKHLEEVVRKAIIDGQPRTHRPWKKILIVVEGIYSMEGVILKLPEIVDIKKRYNCYLYVDEAHSIGALGHTGRGVCEYWGVDTKDIDILMGTYTKSFASAGGYITSNKNVIDYLRANSFSSVSDYAMPVPLAQQIISSLSVIMGLDGTDDGQTRLNQIHENTTYFRKRLRELGFLIVGSRDSPVIPLMVILPSKMPLFSRSCLEKNIAVVMASYPATELELSRARFCVSAGHTREDLDRALDVFTEIGELCLLRYNPNHPLMLANNE